MYKYSARTHKSFENELENIKVSVVRLLFSIFALIAGISIFVIILGYLQRVPQSEYTLQVLIIALSSFLIFGIGRWTINTLNYKIAAFLLVFGFSIIAIFNALNVGTYAVIHLPFLVIAILTVTVVFSVRHAFYYMMAMFASFMVITYLHMAHILTYMSDPSVSNVQDTIILFIFFSVVLKISDIAYGQIEHSYFKALEYSKKLEHLNKALDDKVKQRTKNLASSYQTQVENLHNVVMLGNITKPLLHDLATPLSTLKGGINLMQGSEGTDQKIVEAMLISTEQIESMIQESREMMRGRNIIEIFDAGEVIHKTSKILVSECAKNDIKLDISSEQDTFIKGSISSFERIILNILVNAIEELKRSENARQIMLSITKSKNNVTIRIQDTGRGIKKEYFSKIFDEDFSLKHTYQNFGLGLSFVKKTITEMFRGTITVESEPGEFTSFIIEIPYHEKTS